MFSSLKHKIKLFIYKIVPPPINHDEYYSQSGEDCILQFLFTNKHTQNIDYLELGVYKPKIASNTYKLYKQGYKGVLVEADPSLITEIKAERPKDVVLNIGVSANETAELDFYVFEVAAHSTFNKKEAEYRVKNGSYKLIETKKISVKPINNIISENFKTYPTFLSIDIEGLDYEVIKTLDFNKYPIPVICAETCTYSENHIKPKDDRIKLFMENEGYFVYADTYINTIFVNKKWFYNS